MADSKISALTLDANLTDDDLVVTVNDPGGTPANRKTTLGDVKHYLMPSGLMQPYAMRTAPSGWLICDGTAVSRTTYANLFAAIVATLGTVTITNATPAVVTNTAHGLVTGDQIFLTTTGTLPTGLSPNTLYYIVKIDANSYNLSTTRANAYAGTKIATSSAGSGTHTAWDCPYGLGDGSTTFNVPDARGRLLAGADAIGGTSSNRMTLAQTQGVYANIGASGGEQGHTLALTEAPAHSHTVTDPGFTPGVFNSNVAAGGTGFYSRQAAQILFTDSQGGGGAHNNVQPTLLTNYIIKT